MVRLRNEVDVALPMSIRKIISVTLLAFFGFTGPLQQNSTSLEYFDWFSLVSEVAGNEELRNSLQISDDTSSKMREFLKDERNAGIGSQIRNFSRSRTEVPAASIAQLDSLLLDRLQIAVPEFEPSRVRVLGIRRMFFTPERAFLNSKVHEYLEWDATTIKSLKDKMKLESVSMEEGRNGYEERRNAFRIERAKAIVEDFPVQAQILFTRYAGSELLGKYVQAAEQEGPLELVCHAFNSTEMVINLCRNPTLHQRLRLSPDQLNRVKSIDDAADLRIFDLIGKSIKEEMALIRKKEYAELLAVLSEQQIKQLQQWVGNHFFLADPKRELSREDFRKYLGFTEKGIWKEIQTSIEEKDSQLAMQLSQFNNSVVARLLSMLPPQSSEAASQLFKGVW